MSEKCFCHLNGYKVKDADAREAIAKEIEDREASYSDVTGILTEHAQALGSLQGRVTNLETGTGSGGSGGSGASCVYKAYVMNDGDTITQDELMNGSTFGELEIWAPDWSTFDITYPAESYEMFTGLRYFKTFCSQHDYCNSSTAIFYIEGSGELQKVSNGNPGTPFTLTQHCNLDNISGASEEVIRNNKRVFVKFTPIQIVEVNA